MAVLVGKKAPNFVAKAVLPSNEMVDFDLHAHIEGKYAVVFFYPLDFTFVCPSEIIAFDHKVKQFAALKTELIGVSVDSQFTHFAWKNTPINKGGIGNVQFPLVADLTKTIARDYDVLIEGAGVALRGTFLIDKKGIVRHQVVNDLPLGRNIDEAIRMVEALQFHEAHGEVCPANWAQGKAGMKASTAGVAEYLASHAEKL